MNRINLPYSWKREDFQSPMIGGILIFDRCNCVYNSFDRTVGKSCYTVIENCPTCKETGIMITEEGKAIRNILESNGLNNI